MKHYGTNSILPCPKCNHQYGMCDVCKRDKKEDEERRERENNFMIIQNSIRDNTRRSNE